MGVRLERFPEYGVTLEIFTGVITRELLFGRLAALREGDGALWIIYIDPTVDLSQVDIVTISKLKRANAVRLSELNIDDPKIAFVCDQNESDLITFEFWLRYVQLRHEHPGSQELFPTLAEACDWLDLPQAACTTLTEAVVAETSSGRGAEAAPEGEPPERRP
jgi:hypothetical protein